MCVCARTRARSLALFSNEHGRGSLGLPVPLCAGPSPCFARVPSCLLPWCLIIRTERPSRTLELLDDEQETARAYDTQGANGSLECAQPRTPPRSGSGASCGRPGSRELQRLWEHDNLLLDASLTPAKSLEAYALPGGGEGEFRCERTVHRIASSEIS